MNNTLKKFQSVQTFMQSITNVDGLRYLEFNYNPSSAGDRPTAEYWSLKKQLSQFWLFQIILSGFAFIGYGWICWRLLRSYGLYFNLGSSQKVPTVIEYGFGIMVLLVLAGLLYSSVQIKRHTSEMIDGWLCGNWKTPDYVRDLQKLTDLIFAYPSKPELLVGTGIETSLEKVPEHVFCACENRLIDRAKDVLRSSSKTDGKDLFNEEISLMKRFKIIPQDTRHSRYYEIAAQQLKERGEKFHPVNATD